MQPAHHGIPPVFVSKALKIASYVYLQVDTPRTGFEKPYSGLYKILDRYDKSVKKKNFETERVMSWDRCKPAFQLNDEIVIPQMMNTSILRSLNSARKKKDAANSRQSPTASSENRIRFKENEQGQFEEDAPPIEFAHLPSPQSVNKSPEKRTNRIITLSAQSSKERANRFYNIRH